MKHYTSIEQSKRLLELGLPPESADMSYSNFCPKGLSYSDPYNIFAIPYTEAKEVLDRHIQRYGGDQYDGIIAWNVIPCWSVGALLGLMPANIKAKESTEPYSLMVFKDKVEYNGDDYYRVEYGYGNPMTVGWLNEWYETKGGFDLMESVFLMVVWLLENGYIK